MNLLSSSKYFKNYWVYLAPLVFSGLFFWRLDGASFWFDELVTIRTVINVNTRAFFLNFFSDQLHPPLYFALLKFYFELLSFLNLLNQFLIIVLWANLKFLFDFLSAIDLTSINYAELYSFHAKSNYLEKLEAYNEFTIRLPSALSMTAANILIFDYFKKKNLILLGLVTCFLIGTNTKLIYYAQEARPYALFVLIFILVLREFGQVYDRELKLENFKKLLIFNSLLLMTHFYGVFVVGTEILLLTWINRNNGKVVLSSITVGALFTLLFGGMYDFLNIAKFGFLKKMQFSDLNELHLMALGYFVRGPFVFYLAIAVAIKNYTKKFEESDRIYFGGSLFLAIYLALTFAYTSYWPVFDGRYFVIILPLQILIITTINYSISESLLVFVKNRILKNAGLAVVFVMINMPQMVLQPYFHFKVFDYYESEKYYPVGLAYEAIASDRDFRASSFYVLEEYQGSYFGYFDQKYQVVQLANLYPDEANAVKENKLSILLQSEHPQIFYLIRVRHKETKQEDESIKIYGYSKKRIFLRQNAEAYKFTKEF